MATRIWRADLEAIHPSRQRRYFRVLPQVWHSNFLKMPHRSFVRIHTAIPQLQRYLYARFQSFRQTCIRQRMRHTWDVHPSLKYSFWALKFFFSHYFWLPWWIVWRRANLNIESWTKIPKKINHWWRKRPRPLSDGLDSPHPSHSLTQTRSSISQASVRPCCRRASWASTRTKQMSCSPLLLTA